MPRDEFLALVLFAVPVLIGLVFVMPSARGSSLAESRDRRRNPEVRWYDRVENLIGCLCGLIAIAMVLGGALWLWLHAQS